MFSNRNENIDIYFHNFELKNINFAYLFSLINFSLKFDIQTEYFVKWYLPTDNLT